MSEASEILAQLLSNISDEYQKTVGFPTYDLLAAAAVRLSATDDAISEAARKLNPANLTGAELDSYIYPRAGITRHQATVSIGTVHVTGSGAVYAGDLFESGGGVQFAAAEDTVISGAGDVAIECTQDGAIGNVAAGSITMMPVQLDGITSVTNPQPTTGGYDEETDAALLDRFYIRLRTPPTSGNKWHYLSWALDITGVGYAQVYPLGHGDNTVDVVIIDADGLPADAALVEQVQAYIDPDSAGLGEGEAPIGAHCYVSAATAVNLSVSLTVTLAAGYAEEDVTAAIETAIRSYLQSIAMRQDYVSYAKIAAAINDVPGVLDYEGLTVDGGTDNIAIADREVAVLYETAVTYA